MREILFKAKWKRDGKWVEGLLTIMRGEYHIVHKDNENLAYPIIEDTICQYTGLTDKNGKKIWENDILKSGLVVVWEENFASFCLSKKEWAFRHFFGEAVDGCDCEVIGNIFDNPELLKEGGENGL